jgi:hypothetical protein
VKTAQARGRGSLAFPAKNGFARFAFYEAFLFLTTAAGAGKKNQIGDQHCLISDVLNPRRCIDQKDVRSLLRRALLHEVQMWRRDSASSRTARALHRPVPSMWPGCVGVSDHLKT